jgi:hypothetical protein
MVGLPARGKSYIVQLLSRYLKWCHIQVKVFNVGEYRRKVGREGGRGDDQEEVHRFLDSSSLPPSPSSWVSQARTRTSLTVPMSQPRGFERRWRVTKEGRKEGREGGREGGRSGKMEEKARMYISSSSLKLPLPPSLPPSLNSGGA